MSVHGPAYYKIPEGATYRFGPGPDEQMTIHEKFTLELPNRTWLKMNRAGDGKGFVLPDTPESLGVPCFDDPYWMPFLELCNDTGTPINFHLNAAINPAALTWKNFSFEKALAVASNMFYIGNLATMGNWMVSGLLDRHPKLRIGLIESGMGWIPFGVEARLRDEAVKAGIRIYGLPILAVEPDLDQYFRQSVIGGPGAFIIPVKNYDAFADAILRKLVAEISQNQPAKPRTKFAAK